MTDDNAKGKLTLSAKSTLTLKASVKSGANDGKKMVQVEVRKKRTIPTGGEIKTPKVEIDEATAQKIRLIAEAKEHQAKRQKEQEEKDAARLKEREELEAKRLKEQEEKERLEQEQARLKEIEHKNKKNKKLKKKLRLSFRIHKNKLKKTKVIIVIKNLVIMTMMTRMTTNKIKSHKMCLLKI